jgi:hypothetical protein
MAQLYKIFSGEELEIAEKIQRKRYQMLVHSYIYYEMNENIISDSQWSAWAMELVDLQKQYPEIAGRVPYAKDFEGWDGSSGAFLTYYDKPNIINTANRLLRDRDKKPYPVIQAPSPKKPLISKPTTTSKPSTTKKKLF